MAASALYPVENTGPIPIKVTKPGGSGRFTLLFVDEAGLEVPGTVAAVTLRVRFHPAKPTSPSVTPPTRRLVTDFPINTNTDNAAGQVALDLSGASLIECEISTPTTDGIYWQAYIEGAV